MRSLMAGVLLAGLLMIGQAQACLRATVDERAVQWSGAIVRATLIAVKEPVANAGTSVALVASTWKVTHSFDGPLKPDTEVTVYTFPTPSTDTPPSDCQVLPSVGKVAVLLLRPAKWCEFAQRKDVEKSPGDAYVMVTRLTDDPESEPAVKELQSRIEAVRKAEATFNEKDARFQAETLANALDDTEADHADAALLDMGPKAVATMREVLEKANPRGKERLQRIIEELSPPPADTGKREKP